MSNIQIIIEICATIIQTGVFIIALIAIFQTNKSIEKQKIANEAQAESNREQFRANELLKLQIEKSLEPYFEIKFEEYEFEEGITINSVKKGDFSEYVMNISNISNSVAYDVKVESFIYMSYTDLNKYHTYNIDDLYLYRDEWFNVIKSNESIETFIPRQLKSINQLNYIGFFEDTPVTYIKITYRDLLGNYKTSCYSLKELTSIQGVRNGPDIINPKWKVVFDNDFEYDANYEKLKKNVSKIDRKLVFM